MSAFCESDRNGTPQRGTSEEYSVEHGLRSFKRRFALGHLKKKILKCWSTKALIFATFQGDRLTSFIV